MGNNTACGRGGAWCATEQRGDQISNPFSFYSATENIKPQMEDRGEKKDVGKEERCKEPEPKIDNHEPRLGPRPRSHNKVLNPPGGKSSIAFY